MEVNDGRFKKNLKFFRVGIFLSRSKTIRTLTKLPVHCRNPSESFKK